MRLENGGDDEEQGTHPDRGDEERRLAPPGVYEKEYEYRRCDNLDYAVNP
jgi:hypothetical protein